MNKCYLATVISAAMLITACSGGGGGKDVQKSIDQLQANLNSLSSNANQSAEPTKSNEPANSVEQPKSNEPTNPVEQPKPNEPTKSVEQSKPSEPEKLTENSHSQPEAKPNDINSPADKTDRKFKPGTFKNVDVGIGKLSGVSREYSFNAAWAEISDPTIVEVAGQKVLASSLNGVVPFSGTVVKAFWNTSKDPKREIVYGGIETDVSNIPTSGKITYKGNATRYDNINSSVDNVGKSTLVADFDNKKISGELAMNGLRRNIALKEADITGNSFNGEAVAGENSVFTTRYGNYEDKFFGPNAEEVAGKAEFSKEKNKGDDVTDLNTSFSATAQ